MQSLDPVRGRKETHNCPSLVSCKLEELFFFFLMLALTLFSDLSGMDTQSLLREQNNIQHYFQLSFAGYRLTRQELKMTLGRDSHKDTCWWCCSRLGEKERHLESYFLSEILAARF